MMETVHCPSCSRICSADTSQCPECGEPISPAVEQGSKPRRKFSFIPIVFYLCLAATGYIYVERPFNDPEPVGVKKVSETQTIAAIKPADTPIHLPVMVSSQSAKICDNKHRFRDWYSQCARIFAYTTLPTELEGEHPSKLTLAYDGVRFSILALVPDWYHEKFYTNRMPVLAVLDNEDLVSNRSYFNERFPPTVTVGSDLVDGFEWKGDSHWVASAETSARLIKLFRKGVTAEVDFYLLAGGKQRTEISLLGFTAAMKAATRLTEQPGTAGWSLNPRKAIKMIGDNLSTNVFGVTEELLVPLKNPDGEGFFVYVPKITFDGVERHFVWFVGNSTAINLTGASAKLTPDLPWPRDVPYHALNGTNVLEDELASKGIALLKARVATKKRYTFKLEASNFKDVSMDAIQEMVELTRNQGYRCDSVLVARKMAFERGFVLACNSGRYEYEIVDRGGNWTVRFVD